MKKKTKYTIIVSLVALVYFIQLYRGLFPAPIPGMIQTGAKSEPLGAYIAAFLSAILTWGLLEGLYGLFEKFKKK
ncbi:hypothetical protein KQI82_10610 [Oscillibacter sp. MSJ-2]|uniref:Uncharacterized protein n=1 Tax=Dysosmobacter acutus TaxID=2841504 RepID=A0ABS6FBA1_9FIRM|nr:hypothetical protein [Dysosmobacter acutus]MBU5627358.1 hypothetical protein [Dysosmobacter acutus]